MLDVGQEIAIDPLIGSSGFDCYAGNSKPAFFVDQVNTRTSFLAPEKGGGRSKPPAHLHIHLHLETFFFVLN